MATYTQTNVGTRHFIKRLTAYRNFEAARDPTVAYQGATGRPLRWVDGNVYGLGAVLPFDVAGTSYSLLAVKNLQLWWDQLWVEPTV